MNRGSWAARIILALACAGAVAVLALPNSRLVRIASLVHSESCQLDLQANLPARTQVAAIGSSRTREAMDPAYLSQRLGLGADGVVNLGHPQMAPAYDYGTIAALSRDHAFDLVLVEVLARSDALAAAERTIDTGPDLIAARLSSGPVRDSFITGLSFADQAARVFREAPSVALGLSDFLTLTAKRITTTLALLRTGEIYPRLYRTNPLNDPDRKMICTLRSSRDASGLTAEQRQVRQDKIDGYRALFQTDGWADPDPMGFLTQASSAVDRTTLREMIALSKKRGFALAFFYVPGTHVPVDPGLAPAFEQAFGTPLLIPPAALRAQLDEGGYFDNAHLNEAGSHHLIDWLAGQIAGSVAEARP